MQKLWILTQFENLTLMSQYFPEYSEIGPLQAHTNGHSQVSPARGTTPYPHRYVDRCCYIALEEKTPTKQKKWVFEILKKLTPI